MVVTRAHIYFIFILIPLFDMYCTKYLACMYHSFFFFRKKKVPTHLGYASDTTWIQL